MKFFSPSHWTAVVCYIQQAKEVGKGPCLILPAVEADMIKTCKTAYKEETWTEENIPWRKFSTSESLRQYWFSISQWQIGVAGELQTRLKAKSSRKSQSLPPAYSYIPRKLFGGYIYTLWLLYVPFAFNFFTCLPLVSCFFEQGAGRKVAHSLFNWFVSNVRRVWKLIRMGRSCN